MSKFLSILVLCVLSFALLTSLAYSQGTEPPPITTFDKPFLFAYGTWQDKAKIEGGRAILRGGATPRGGAGANVERDLSGVAGYSPALRVRVGAANKMKVIRLMLRDTGGHGGTWNFNLPAPGNETVITPQESFSLAHPSSLDKPDQPLDLKHIQQWQMVGDWSSDDPLDMEVSAILLIAPNAKMLGERAKRAAQDKADAEKRQQDQENQKAKYRSGTPASPVVREVYLVAPDILALRIQAAKVVPGSLTRYAPQTGDEKRSKGTQVLLVRGGQEIGSLIGQKREYLVAFENVEGDPLLEFVADKPETYTIHSADDAKYANIVFPTAVYRKSKPTDWAQPGRGFAMSHIVYLKTPIPLVPGKTYTIALSDLNTQKREIVFHCDPNSVRSEAVHVNQIGYRPDDPVKRAFLSIWLGTGGVYRYPTDLHFSLVNTATGKSVYRGDVALAKDAADPEAMWKSQNFNGTSVYRLDFSDFKTPGTYRAVVEGVGCSYPFVIGRNVWEKAFRVQMSGLYNERSGVTLGPPYTNFKKPRDFYPGENGFTVTQSTYSYLEKGGEAWADLVKGDTHQPVPQAWGGYHDAGDWNPRRVTHMAVTLMQMELLELFPQTYKTLRLRIPPTPGIPDLLTEALFELDCFRRLQKPDGGVPFGIETNGDPIDGEVSWIQSMPAYVFAPDIDSSYYYAAVAARAAHLLQAYKPALAMVYTNSALRAMAWAEKRYPSRTQNAANFDKDHWQVRDNRNFAALQLYQLTRDHHWHDVFLENTSLKTAGTPVFAYGDHVQRDAAFAYARLDNALADPAIRRNALAAVVQQAEASLTYAGGNAFNITTPDKGKPMFIGFYSAPDSIELARAHYLTHDPKYLAGAVQACQFSGGDNPANMTYTTGLGANPPLHPLHLDSRRTGQPAPPGFTPYGNIDYSQWHDNFETWPLTYFLNAICKPAPMEWPTTEAYFDIFLYPAQNEFTVDRWAPNLFVWGYLAARR